MNIYIGKNYKNYTLSSWVAQTSVSDKAKGSQKMIKGGKKKTWTLNAYLSSFVCCSNRLLHSSFPPRLPSRLSTSPEMLEQENVSSFSTVLQEADLSPTSREVPWWGLLPTSRKAFLNLFICGIKMLQFRRALTDFFTLAKYQHT